jgi:hypothetical protein
MISKEMELVMSAFGDQFYKVMQNLIETNGGIRVVDFRKRVRELAIEKLRQDLQNGAGEAERVAHLIAELEAFDTQECG